MTNQPQSIDESSEYDPAVIDAIEYYPTYPVGQPQSGEGERKKLYNALLLLPDGKGSPNELSFDLGALGDFILADRQRIREEARQELADRFKQHAERAEYFKPDVQVVQIDSLVWAASLKDGASVEKETI